MRNNHMMRMAAAALLVVGGAAFQAQATMGGADLSGKAKSYSLIENASCSGQGMFCRAGSSLQCKPLCVCVPRRSASSRLQCSEVLCRLTD
jgi:hypothetical protein